MENTIQSQQSTEYGIPVADYQRLSKLDLSAYQRSKQNLTYIPWGVSMQILKTYDPTLDVDFERNTDGDPCFGNEKRGWYVQAYLTRNGVRISANLIHAVRDYRNKAVKDPDITVVTNSIQRAIAKCVAIHTGIGMSLYSQIDESIDFIKEDGTIEPWQAWKSPKEAAAWAMDQGVTKERCKELWSSTLGAGSDKPREFYLAVTAELKK